MARYKECHAGLDIVLSGQSMVIAIVLATISMLNLDITFPKQTLKKTR
jgi:hypothetical protein